MTPGHLVDVGTLSDATIHRLLKRTAELLDGAAPMTVQGTVANLFFEPSTRTRVSFELAARRVGLEVVNIDHSSSSATKGETLEDTARTLAAMGVGLIVVRHPEDGAAERLARLADTLPADQRFVVINAGDGCRGHPTQALLDAATLSRAGLVPSGLKIALIGDLRHSRVARSDVELLARLGAAEIRIAGPAEFMPGAGEFGPARRFASIDEAIAGVDAVICLRIQRERIRAGGYSDGDAFHRAWGLTPERLAALPDHARVLHPGPVNRGVELDSAVADDPRALILDQVRTGVHLRTAVFELLAGASPARPDPDHRRRVRSFVRRPGRLTPAQQRALDELLPRYAIPAEPAALDEAFERPAGLVVEIGFGNGQSLAAMAEAEPRRNFVGIEVHEPGIGRLLRTLEERDIENVRIAARDAVEVVSGQTAEADVDEFRIYFPDPWPKKRHHKRRLIQPEFVALLADRLADGGLLHLATDWPPYAEWMLEVLNREASLENLGDPYVPRPEWRPQTHFERRGQQRGHPIVDLLYRRRPRSESAGSGPRALDAGHGAGVETLTRH